MVGARVSIPAKDRAASAGIPSENEFDRIHVGHWTDREAVTGCTVALFDRSVLAAIDVRGGAPGTRETDVLGPGRLVQRVDAICITGGSAFGLAAADGMMRFLADQERGFPTEAGPVPIVPTAVIYDLGVGRPDAPDDEAGRLACLAAVPWPAAARGRVGVGTGATTSKLVGPRQRGGFGIGHCAYAGGAVLALAVVNACGDVVAPDSGQPILQPETALEERRRQLLTGPGSNAGYGESTTIVVVAVDGPCDYPALTRCTIAAHDGMAHAIRPCHTIFDGDIAYAVALDEGTPSATEVLRLAVAAEVAVERAIVDAVRA